MIREAMDKFRRRFQKTSANGVWFILAIIVALWLASGIVIVQPDEEGVMLRFGKVTRQVGSGINWNWPWPVGRVFKPGVTRVQKIEVGFRTIDVGPPAKYRTVPQEALMLTGDENIVSLEFIVQYKVRDANDYLLNVRDSVGALQGTLHDASEAAMREVMGRTEIDLALTEGKGEIQLKAQELIQKFMDEYKAGVQVVTVKLQDVNPPRGAVSDAFKDVISAQQDKERLINEARGFAKKIVNKARGQASEAINQAEGYRQARITEAEGEANRFLALLGEYRKGKTVTKKRLYLEMLEEVMPKVEKIVIEGGTARNVLPYLPLNEMKRNRNQTARNFTEGGER